MPVNSQHPDYSRMLPRWRKNRDAFDGEDCVKARGETYLISPGGFKQRDYDRYLQRAKWFGATSRTIEGLVGAAMQKQPEVEASERVKQHMANVTLTGLSLNLLAGLTLSDALLLGRYAILLDWNEEEGRPYWSGYPAECLVNWKTTVLDGKEILTMYVLKETVYEAEDEYESESVMQYRVGRLTNDGVYQVEIYRELENDRGYTQIEETLIPDRRGKSLDFIPMQIFSARDLTPHVSGAPMSPLVDVNYAYYRHSADYEHGLFMTALPTAVVTGHDMDEGEPLQIGSLSAWVIHNPEAKAYFLEYQGHGLESHEKAMTNDKVEMATLGARLLEEQPDTQETFGAVRLRHSGENSILTRSVNLTSDGMTRLLQWHHWWDGDTETLEDEQFYYRLNTDFTTARMTSQDLTALVAAWQSGALPDEDVWWNLRQGELLPDGRSFEDWQALLAAREPARLPFGDGDGINDVSQNVSQS